MAILIVDDDPVQCRLLEAMLQKSGYETVVLDNGDAALTLLGGADGARIDCVILDLVMPNLDGLGVLEEVRRVPDLFNIEIAPSSVGWSLAGSFLS